MAAPNRRGQARAAYEDFWEQIKLGTNDKDDSNDSNKTLFDVSEVQLGILNSPQEFHVVASHKFPENATIKFCRDAAYIKYNHEEGGSAKKKKTTNDGDQDLLSSLAWLDDLNFNVEQKIEIKLLYALIDRLIIVEPDGFATWTKPEAMSIETITFPSKRPSSGISEKTIC
jgi:hypothetical protein